MGSRDKLRTNRFLNSILKRWLIVLLSKDATKQSLEPLLKTAELFLVNYTKNFRVEFLQKQIDDDVHKLAKMT